MRKYKFRGKSTTEFDDKKIWLYGDLLQPTELCNIYEISDCTSIDGSRYQVEKDSIGQYTGLHDKNGKEIYEEDIVKVKHHNAIYVGTVKFDEEHCEYRIELVDAYINLWKKLKDIEVIGNATDNAELLEE